MTPDQIRYIVKMTLDELDQRHMLVDPYKNILHIVDKRLNEYFSGTKDAGITAALRQLSDDPYTDIIYLQYRDNKTIEAIAEYYDKDISTIKRNKKRLIKIIYGVITESIGEQ